MPYRFDEYTLDDGRYLLLRDEETVAVEPQVFDLLRLLVANAGRVVSRDEIFEEVWKGRIVSDSALSSRIKAARRAIGDDGASQRLIRTVHGRGFLFQGDLAADGAAPVAAEAAAPAANALAGEPAGESTEDLTRSVMARPAIAVLPFVDLGEEAGRRHLASGITEEIMAALSAWRWFPVIARNTAFRHAGSDRPADEIGRAIGARYLVTGSLQQGGGRIRLSAALIDAERNREIWSGSYRRESEALFEIEEELAREIVAALEVQLNTAELGRIRLKAPGDMTAWDLAQQASWLLNKGTPEAIDEAERLARQSADLDEGWSYPYALIAFARFERAMHSWTGAEARDAFRETHEAARTALEVDQGSWMAHALSGVGELWMNGNHDKARAHLHRALQINPTAPWSFHFSGCVTGFSGDPEAASKLQPRVFTIDPLYPYTAVVEADLALWCMLSGEMEAASDHIGKSLAWDKSYGRGQHRAVAIEAARGNRKEARAMYQRLSGNSNAFDPDYIRQSYPFRREEHRERFFDGLRQAGINI